MDFDTGNIARFMLDYSILDGLGKTVSLTCAKRLVQLSVKLTWFRLRYAARFLLNLFRVKLGCGRKIGGQLTQTVSAPSEAWRFSQGESPCRTRPNQPFVPSVAVMKEAAKVG